MVGEVNIELNTQRKRNHYEASQLSPHPDGLSLADLPREVRLNLEEFVPIDIFLPLNQGQTNHAGIVNLKSLKIVLEVNIGCGHQEIVDSPELDTHL